MHTSWGEYNELRASGVELGWGILSGGDGPTFQKITFLKGCTYIFYSWQHKFIVLLQFLCGRSCIGTKAQITGQVVKIFGTGRGGTGGI